jgi:hypothetical protein
LENKVLADKFIHSDQITQRLEFISFYAKSHLKVNLLTSDVLETLWEELVAKSSFDNDNKCLFLWLREVCDSIAEDHKNSKKTIVSLDDLMKFYNEKMKNWSDDPDKFKNISIQGFFCI